MTKPGVLANITPGKPKHSAGAVLIQALSPTGHVRPSRKLGLLGASTSNMLNMIGVGPFLSIPLAMAAMHGSFVLLAWGLGAVISLCDGLVWAELGSAMPSSGGSYVYLRNAFGTESWGKLAGFLVLWSTVLTTPLLVASGAVGFAQYFHNLYPSFREGGLTLVAMAVCAANVLLLYRRIDSVGIISIGLWLVVIGTMLWIILGAVTHIPDAFREQIAVPPALTHGVFWEGVGAATLIAVYDYAGYYNVCLIGGEIKRPERTIPRSILLSIVLIAMLYIAMNLAILGILPKEQSIHSTAIVADFMQRAYSPNAARIADLLVLVAAFASVFAILLGTSRIPFAAAQRGEFFTVFARKHPSKGFPYVSLLVLGTLSACACVLSLNTLIGLLIAIQTIVQFLAQCVAVVVLRRRDRAKGGQAFRMPLYPLPVAIAAAGWLFVLMSSGARNVLLAFALTLAGIAIYFVSRRGKLQFSANIV